MIFRVVRGGRAFGLRPKVALRSWVGCAEQTHCVGLLGARQGLLCQTKPIPRGRQGRDGLTTGAQRIVRNKANCRGTGNREPEGELCQTKPNVGGMGYLEKSEHRVWGGSTTQRIVRNKANLRRNTKPRRPRHGGSAERAKQSQFRGRGPWDCGLRIEGRRAFWCVCNGRQEWPCETKPIAKGGWWHSPRYERGLACETKPICGTLRTEEPTMQPLPPGCAKQSQFPGPRLPPTPPIRACPRFDRGSRAGLLGLSS